MASLVLMMSVSLDGFRALLATEPVSTTAFSGGSAAHVFAARP